MSRYQPILYFFVHLYLETKNLSSIQLTVTKSYMMLGSTSSLALKLHMLYVEVTFLFDSTNVWGTLLCVTLWSMSPSQLLKVTVRRYRKTRNSRTAQFILYGRIFMSIVVWL